MGNKTKVKICGITSLKDAVSAVFAGADALGFVFYRKSPRYISPRRARVIIRLLPKRVLKVGVFVNAREEIVKRIARYCCLDILQFHGDESAEFCAKFRRYKIIKAFRLKERLDLGRVFAYNTFAYLFDNFSRLKPGGTGKAFDWKILKEAGRMRRPVFLSAGLNAHNVSKAIAMIRPEWVDASSSLEISPGRKDYQKISMFIRRVKGPRTIYRQGKIA
ncbi:MAG: phosphoribosylanthranilate isomerase [Candidatus Omnitrophota bacterium]